MAQRHVKKEWVHYVLENHHTNLPCKDQDDVRRYFGTLTDGRLMQVWVNETSGSIVPVAWGND